MFFKESDPCASSPCLNGASCELTSNRIDYTCDCMPDYEGVNCETKKRVTCKIFIYKFIFIRLIINFVIYSTMSGIQKRYFLI